MYKKIIIGMSLVAIAFSSCSNENELNDEVAIQSQHFISAGQAVENATAFIESFNTETRSGESKTLEVASVVEYRKDGHSVAKTRGSSDSAPVLFYAINYKDDGGFVLAAADNRHQPVYAYVPKGSFDESGTSDSGFDYFIDNITQRITEGNDTVLWAENNVESGQRSIVTPKLSTEWGRGFPYNQYAQPSLTYLTTMSVALAQIAAYRSSPSSYPSYDTGDTATLGWYYIRLRSSFHDGHMIEHTAESDSLARFMRSIEDGYTYESLYNSQVCINRLFFWGWYNSNALEGFTKYDISEVLSSLGHGYLLYTRARASAYSPNLLNQGYAWVMDGCNGNYLHCNWGNDGVNNGYFLASGFTPISGSYTYDTSMAYCGM